MARIGVTTRWSASCHSGRIAGCRCCPTAGTSCRTTRSRRRCCAQRGLGRARAAVRGWVAASRTRRRCRNSSAVNCAGWPATCNTTTCWVCRACVQWADGSFCKRSCCSQERRFTCFSCLPPRWRPRPIRHRHSRRCRRWLLTAAWLGALYAPKLLGYAEVVLSRRQRERYGGIARFAGGVAAEFGFSLLLDAVSTVAKTTAMLRQALGARTRWIPQNRADRSVGWREATRLLWPQTALGLLVFSGFATAGWVATLWALPLAGGLLAADPALRRNRRPARRAMAAPPSDRGNPRGTHHPPRSAPFAHATRDGADVAGSGRAGLRETRPSHRHIVAQACCVGMTWEADPSANLIDV